MHKNYSTMLEAVERIATFQDLKAVYKTRDAMRQIAADALANLQPL
jgi:hypothetical protein